MNPSLCEVRDLLIEYHSWEHLDPVGGLFYRLSTLPRSKQELLLTKGDCFLVLHEDTEDGFPEQLLS